MKRVGIVGATGAVGSELLNVLERRNFPVSELRLFASSRSDGNVKTFKNSSISVQDLALENFPGLDIVFFSAGATRSKDYAPKVVKSGGIVIDNSSAFRMEKDVPLVIPEINISDISYHKGIISVPNCCAVVLLMAIYPLLKISKIRRLIVSTYQAVSGAGAKAINELIEQTHSVLDNKPINKNVFKHQIAFNLFSHDTMICDNGYNFEENKVIEETKKILHDESIAITTTCIRVPVLRAHTESIYIEFENKVNLNDVRHAYEKAEGVTLMDDRTNNHFPMPIEAQGKDNIFVGRIREDLSNPKAISLLACGDQLLKGAALDAVQIAECII